MSDSDFARQIDSHLVYYNVNFLQLIYYSIENKFYLNSLHNRITRLLFK